MKPRSMVTRQSLPGHRSKAREAAECVLFVAGLFALIFAMSIVGFTE